MIDTPKQLSMFDYNALDVETRERVQQRTERIKFLVKRSAQDIIEIGQMLIEQKEDLEHGQFLDWLRVEFDWSDRTAENLMNVAKVFKFETVSNLDIGAKTLYLLSSKSTPDTARDEILARAEKGETITYTEAKETVEYHKFVADTYEGDEPEPPQPDENGVIEEHDPMEVWRWDEPEEAFHTGSETPPIEPEPVTNGIVNKANLGTISRQLRKAKEQREREKFKYEHSPGVKEGLDKQRAANLAWMREIKRLKWSIEADKYSPEAIRFFVHCLREFQTDIDKLIEEIEEHEQRLS